MPSKELRFALCSCGKPVYDTLDYCLPCLQARSQRYTLPMRPGTPRQRSPPPTQLPSASPRSSSADPTILPLRSSSRASGSARDVFTHALSQEGNQGSSFLPQQLYRTPARSTSRNSSSTRRPSDSPQRRVLSPASLEPSRRPSRSSTPDAMSAEGYAPMAGAFARLSRKDGAEVMGSKSPTSSGRASIDSLGARMLMTGAHEM